MGSPYRTAAEIAGDIPERSRSWRLALAALIVAPVRLVEWCWPWLAANAALSFALIPVWSDVPRIAAFLVAGVNVAAGVGLGACGAYRWAVKEIESDQAGGEST